METTGVWFWRITITSGILAAGILYVRGYRPLATRPPRLSLLSFMAGLLLLFITLVSPLHQLASQDFLARVAQQLLLITWIPFLLITPIPLPTLQAGLPLAWQRRLQQRTATLSYPGWLHLLTTPGSVWILFVSCFWLWYDPTLHQAALTYPWLRSIEIGLLFTPAVLYWWHITGTFPVMHQPLPLLARVVYTVAITIPVKIVGFVFLITQETIYDYAHTLAFSGLHIDSQSLGGLLVWALGGLVYSTTAIYLIRQWLDQEEQKPTLPASTWDTEEAMLAPGLSKQR